VSGGNDQAHGNTISDDVKRTTIGNSIDRILEVLERHSRSEVQTILKMVCGTQNLRTSSVFAPTGTVGPIGFPSEKLTRKVTPPQVKDPVLKQIRNEISSLNKQISAESLKTGKPLSAEHPLIQRRNYYFRDLKGYKDRGIITTVRETQTEAKKDC